jgi:hypothetical protein
VKHIATGALVDKKQKREHTVMSKA